MVRQTMIPIELTSEQILLNSAACAIVSAVIGNPEEVYMALPKEKAEVFLQAATEIVKHMDAWNPYLEKMLDVVRKCQDMTNV